MRSSQCVTVRRSVRHTRAWQQQPSPQGPSWGVPKGLTHLACFGIGRVGACANGSFDVTDVCAQAQVACVPVGCGCGVLYVQQQERGVFVRPELDFVVEGALPLCVVLQVGHAGGSPSTLEPNVYPAASAQPRRTTESQSVQGAHS